MGGDVGPEVEIPAAEVATALNVFCRISAKWRHEAAAFTNKALSVAQDISKRQYEALMAYAPEMPHHLAKGVLAQFLWGVFYEIVVEGDKFPTNGYDRLMVLLIFHLMNEEGSSLGAARAYVKDLEKLFNEADYSFEHLTEAGRRAYRTGERPRPIVCAFDPPSRASG